MADDLSLSLGLDGPGISVTIEGLTWTFMPLSQTMKGEYANWVRQRARDAAVDMELVLNRKAREMRKALALRLDASGKGVPQDEQDSIMTDIYILEESAERQIADFNANLATGLYHFNGVLCRSSLSSPEGSAKAVQIMLTPKHPGITLQKAEELTQEHPEEIKQVVREVQNLGKSQGGSSPVKMNPTVSP